MEVHSVTACPSATEKLGVLVALFFPLIALAIAIRARRGGFAFALMPLLVNAGIASLQLRHVLELLAITGSRSVTALSAGVAEAQRPLIAGAVAAIVCAVIGALSVRRRPGDVQPRRAALAIVLVALLLAAAEPPFALALARFAQDQIGLFWRICEIFAVIAFAGTAAALFALRGAAVRPQMIAAACALVIVAEAWLVLRYFEHVAIYGY